MKSRASFTFIVLLLPGAVTAISAGTAETVRARRLVVCLDGTQNSPEQEVKGFPGHKLYKPTTVLKTLRAILPVGKDGVSQISYYSDGVGSMIGDDTGYSRFAVGVDRIFGGATALGYDSRVKSAYRFLVANYQAGDQIFVFGFSRGAAEAQTLVRFVEWVGSRLPEHDVGGLLFKKNEYWIPELYEGFKHSCTADEVFEKILRRNRNSTGVKEAAIAEPGPAKPACRDLEPLRFTAALQREGAGCPLLDIHERRSHSSARRSIRAWQGGSWRVLHRRSLWITTHHTGREHVLRPRPAVSAAVQI
jgi:hypothetical protein